MKAKNIGKLTMVIAAGTALVVTLINDSKEKLKDKSNDGGVDQEEN